MSKKNSLSIFLLSVFVSIGCYANQKNAVNQDMQTIVLIAIEDFKTVGDQPLLSYIDDARQSLAVDAMKFKDQFARVQTTFLGPSGTYRIKLTALTEIDGESQYQVSIGRDKLELMSNPETDIDFTPYVHEWKDIVLKQGDTISVAFNSTTNGKIPEGDTTAYSRGRWTKLELVCTSGCDD